MKICAHLPSDCLTNAHTWRVRAIQVLTFLVSSIRRSLSVSRRSLCSRRRSWDADKIHFVNQIKENLTLPYFLPSPPLLFSSRSQKQTLSLLVFHLLASSLTHPGTRSPPLYTDLSSTGNRMNRQSEPTLVYGLLTSKLHISCLSHTLCPPVDALFVKSLMYVKSNLRNIGSRSGS